MSDTPNKKILLGVTGGIAAYKSAELVRRLGERGADVHVVMTEAACGFITPATMQALSGNPVYTSMWDTRVPDSMAHIALSRDKDLIIVAPATADFLASSRTDSPTICFPRCALHANVASSSRPR